MSTKRIYPFLKVILMMLFIVLIYFLGRTTLSLKAKSWLAVNICFAIVILLVFASLIKALYRRGSMGIYACVVTIIFIIVVFACYIVYSYLISLAQEARNESLLVRSAEKNMLLLSQEMIYYARNHNGQLPSADNWCDVIIEQNEKITRTTFKNPGIESGICNFAFNKNLSIVDINSVPSDVVMLFEANGDWNLNGDAELLEKARTERQWVIGVVFVDGAFGKYFFCTGYASIELPPDEASRFLKWTLVRK